MLVNAGPHLTCATVLSWLFTETKFTLESTRNFCLGHIMQRCPIIQSTQTEFIVFSVVPADYQSIMHPNV